MNEIIKNIEAAQLKAEVPEFNTGDTVRVHALIKEGNRERVQIFEGTVLKKQGGSNRATFTVRKNSNGVGVEKTWPLHSPHVVKVEVIRRGKVRRAKLNYLRDRVLSLFFHLSGEFLDEYKKVERVSRISGDKRQTGNPSGR